MIDPKEQLTDNSKIEKYYLCKSCKFSQGNDNWSNRYDKCYCMVFAYPESKPIEVMQNGPCDFYVEATK